MTDCMTEREYWAEVQSIADTIAEDSLEECDTREAVDEWTYEQLWETVDGHQWIIYTHYNHDVLRFSPNDGYTLENWGADSVTTDGVLNWAALAFGALYADVQERLGDAVEEAWDARADRQEQEAKS